MKTTQIISTTVKSLVVAAAILGTSAMADGAATYKKCASCHGVNGEKVALGKSKVIADMSKEDLVASMNGYKDGSYGGPMKGLMKAQVAKLSAEEIESLATYIAGLKK
jgi:cytochrome c553